MIRYPPNFVIIFPLFLLILFLTFFIFSFRFLFFAFFLFFSIPILLQEGQKINPRQLHISRFLVVFSFLFDTLGFPLIAGEKNLKEAFICYLLITNLSSRVWFLEIGFPVPKKVSRYVCMKHHEKEKGEREVQMGGIHVFNAIVVTVSLLQDMARDFNPRSWWFSRKASLIV
ncbi:mitochondrial ATPase inhibitor [Histoplasma capsulatum G186AR]|uniref:Mitochondrial ATPase inhibitor n=1 Tax=Ajellomyces capsulatus TaxID=5037 RepID=A0A8H7Z8S7_AJECA|nr:mitochondrial ATPase inhibitor [Histoplasma capsulatum]QSS71449.1 mitochondrial ATPase inhibitor [Histoplasma capsulatum G186AR]